MLSLVDVRKSYGATRALDGLSLEVARDEIVAMLGPNGAGKTTAIEIALGLRAADSGSVKAFGVSPRDARVRARIGVTPQESGFPDALRVEELVAFAASHYPKPASVRDTLDAFGLGALAARRAGELSGGESRRVALALAFAGNPDLAVLDEPTTGLDVESRRRLWDVVRAAARGRSILFSTHYLEEAEALATRAIVIDRGRAIFDGTPAALRDRFGKRRVTYRDATDLPVMAEVADSDAFVRDLVSSGVRFSQLEVARPSMEEAFLAITGGSK